MSDSHTAIVTGAFGFTGRSIARYLLSAGYTVRTLTAHPTRPHDFGDSVEVAPLGFDNPAQLTESLRGADVLYNTYWIRFERGAMTFEKAAANSLRLLEAAKAAGTRRIVHVSITNPSEDSPLPYFRGKAVVERAMRESGLSHAILRPAVIFGDKGILINNIAWFLRRLPAFVVPGSGRYQMQPVFVEDLAALAVEWGARDENVTLDAVGPEKLAFNEVVQTIREAVRSRSMVVHLPPALALIGSKALGALVRDVVLTRDEVAGLLQNLLVSDQPLTCPTRISDWIRENADTLGRTYFSELSAHYRG